MILPSCLSSSLLIHPPYPEKVAPKKYLGKKFNRSQLQAIFSHLKQLCHFLEIYFDPPGVIFNPEITIFIRNTLKILFFERWRYFLKTNCKYQITFVIFFHSPLLRFVLSILLIYRKTLYCQFIHNYLSVHMFHLCCNWKCRAINNNWIEHIIMERKTQILDISCIK